MTDLTVIIPTFNRSEILRVTLESLSNLESPDATYEIIVVDNNSSDHTKEVVDSFVDKIPIKYLFEAKQGKNNALNAAINLANGEVLIFTDDDVLVSINWLSEIHSATQRHPAVDIFGGKILPKFPEGTPDWIQKSDYSAFVFAIHDQPQPEGIYLNSGTPAGANCWVRRRVFDEGTLYDTEIGPKGYGRISGSELEFFTRLVKQGNMPVYIPSAVVIHRIQKFQTSKKYLIKRSYASGRGFVYISRNLTYPCIFGVPRFLFRQLMVSSVKAVYCYLKRDIKSSFEHVMTAAHRVGCIKQYRVVV